MAIVVIASLGFGVALIRGDVLQRRTAVDLHPRDGRAAVGALPVWPEPAEREAQAYLHVASSQRSRRAGRAAVAAEREAHRRDPSDTAVSLALGNLELTYGSRAAARAAFADALRWDPYSAQALIALAGFATADGHRQERARLCARAHAVAPESHCRFPVPPSPARRLAGAQP
jgi:tetratricopeptide (TPR) repeat protein